MSNLVCWYPRHIYNPTLGHNVTVRCGRCPGCLRHRRNEWIERLNVELNNQPVNTTSYFITLTYDDLNCPSELVKRDLQLFFKRLRKITKLRYFACGEYGPQTHRPHYHAVIFGIPPIDILNAVQHCWTLGFVSVSPANPARLAYLCKYILKSILPISSNPLKRPTLEQPPFMLCSKRPAIGLSKLTPELEAFLLNRGCYHGESGNSMSAPRIYKKKIRDKYPVEFAKMSNENEKAAFDSQFKFVNKFVDIDYHDAADYDLLRYNKVIKHNNQI